MESILTARQLHTLLFICAQWDRGPLLGLENPRREDRQEEEQEESGENGVDGLTALRVYTN